MRVRLSREELLSLSWNDVNFAQTVITIFGRKTGDRRSVPLTQRVLNVLQTRKKTQSKVRALKENFVFTDAAGQRVNVHTLRSAFEGALAKAEIERFRFHDLRHTFATRLAQSGVDPYTIQRLMGHKTFSTSQRYAHHCVESLRRGIDAFEVTRKAMQDNEVITILSQ
jgi:integrase